jgi:hypothetical protein
MLIDILARIVKDYSSSRQSVTKSLLSPKVKLSLCLIEHHTMGTYGEWRYGFRKFNLDPRR